MFLPANSSGSVEAVGHTPVIFRDALDRALTKREGWHPIVSKEIQFEYLLTQGGCYQVDCLLIQKKKWAHLQLKHHAE